MVFVICLLFFLSKWTYSTDQIEKTETAIEHLKENKLEAEEATRVAAVTFSRRTK